MGTNMLRQDDAYSFQIINKILETVVPALVTVGLVSLCLVTTDA